MRCITLSLTMALAALAGCNSSTTTGGGNNQPAAKLPDEQYLALIADYENLSAKEREGPKGQAILAKIKDVKGQPSEKVVEELGRFQSTNNLRQIGEAIHNYEDSKFGTFPPRGKGVVPDLTPEDVFGKGKLPVEFPKVPTFISPSNPDPLPPPREKK